MLLFAERHSLILALCFIVIGGIRIAATYQVFSNTLDEPTHLACGLEYLGRHIYRYETQHPPLARVMVALGPYLDGARPRGIKDFHSEGIAQICHGGHPDRTVFLMRMGILPFFFLGSMVVYFWTCHHFDKSTAVASTGLFTMLPPVLAHAGLATTDMALTACLGAAFFALILWNESPTFRRSLLLGATTALAVLSKFTALGFMPIAAAFALILYLVMERPSLKRVAALAKERLAPFGFAMLAGALLIWAGYSFSFGNVPRWKVPLPAPELFDGVRMALAHAEAGHQAYLFGQLSAKGWWYYFPTVLAVKTPIAFLLLLSFGIWLCFRNRVRSAYWLPLAFSLGTLAPAMAGNVNIGVRHVLPVYIGFSIVAAIAVMQLAERARSRTTTRWGVGVALVWMALAGAVQHPDYLAYFNEFVGAEREKVLIDSDLDWGQDMKRLAKRLHELGAREVSFLSFETSEDLQAWPGLPPVKPIHPFIPLSNWTAVGPTLWKLRLTWSVGPINTLWFERLQPTERVGSLLLYYVPTIPPTDTR